MTEAEGVKLQQFRLNEIKKVAENIGKLREKREKTKKEYEQSATSLIGLNSQIKQYKELFEEMKSLTGISIPSAETKKRANFFDQAEETFKDNIVLQTESHEL